MKLKEKSLDGNDHPATVEDALEDGEVGEDDVRLDGMIDSTLPDIPGESNTTKLIGPELPSPPLGDPRSRENVGPQETDVNRHRLMNGAGAPDSLDKECDTPTMVPSVSGSGNSTSGITNPAQILENIKMAYWWAGYYSGLHEGLQQAGRPLGPQG